jgi:hypothetical protein
MKIQQHILLLILACFIFSNNSVASTTPTDVYNLSQKVAENINLIRLEMGVPEKKLSDIAISDAQPREVYFQALTLFKKSNRLLFEQLRERVDTPIAAPENIKPSDVFRLVDKTNKIILQIKQALNINETVLTESDNVERTPDEVYKLIIQTNRTLNALLQSRFAPAEVYQQVTYGVGLTSTIMATVLTSNRLGTEPAFVRRKTPTQVYRKLIDIYSIIHDVIKISGKNCLVIAASEYKRENISPSDVYDLASLLVSELKYLHTLTPNVSPAKNSYYPGDKLPSHVFQRAGRLESQINRLQKYVTTHKDWLNVKR